MNATGSLFLEMMVFKNGTSTKKIALMFHTRVCYPSSTNPPTPTYPPRFTPILGQYPSTQYPSLFFDGYIPIPNTHGFWWVGVGRYVSTDCGNSLTPGRGMEGIKNVCLSKSSCCLVISSTYLSASKCQLFCQTRRQQKCSNSVNF